MKIKLRENAITFITDRGRSPIMLNDLRERREEYEIAGEMVPLSEIIQTLESEGITDIAGDVYQQHLDWKEAKRQEELDRIVQEQAEREAFRESPEGQAEIRKQQLDEVDREARMIAYESLIQKELESIKPAVDKVRQDVGEGKVTSVKKALRDEVNRGHQSRQIDP